MGHEGVATSWRRLGILAVLVLGAGVLPAPPARAVPAAPAAAGAPVPDGSTPTTTGSAPHPSPAQPTYARAAGNSQVSDPGSLVNDPTTDGLNDTQAETAITFSGTNVVAAFEDSGSTALGNHRNGYAVSTDGGASFTDRGMLPASALGDGSNPVLATDTTTGRVYLATMTFTGRDQLQLFRSDDGGVTFGPPVNPTPGFAGRQDLLDRVWMTVDNFPGGPGSGQGNVYIVWQHFGGPSLGGTYLSRSTDGGNTWTQQDITRVEGGTEGPNVVVAPDHSVLLAMFYKPYAESGDGSIRVRRSTDQGRTFGPLVTVTALRNWGVNGNLGLWGGFRTNSYPQMAVNPANGDVYLVFNDWSELKSDFADVYLTVSHDLGATWSPPRRVDSDTGDSDQYMPAIGVTPDGTHVAIGFYDRRVDNWLIRRMTVIGDVSGTTVTFGHDFAMGISYPPVVAQDPLVGISFMGGFDQIVADNGSFYTTWTDNRDPHLGHANQPDVRFAKIPVDLSSRPADLHVTVTVPPAPLPVVATSEATVVVGNAGPEPASYVEATIRLPSDFAITSVSTAQGACVSTVEQKVSCALGTLAPGASATIVVRADAGTTPGPATVTAQVSSATRDLAPADDSASATMTVASRPTAVMGRYSSGPVQTTVTGIDATDLYLDVPDTGGILDVDVRAHLAHVYGNNVALTLISPDGTEVPLVDGRGMTEFRTGPNDCTGPSTNLDDQAAQPVWLAHYPYSGVFRPAERLAAMRGGTNAGTWRLRVAATDAFTPIVVVCWELDVLRDTAAVAPPPPPAPGGLYHALAPARILDTRDGTGGYSTPVGPSATIAVPVTGVGGVPSGRASAVVLNVTVTQPSAGGYLTVYPSGTTRPATSNLNFGPGQTIANLVVAGVGTDGKVAIYNQAGTTAVVADVVGWYGAPGVPGGTRLHPVAPARILDTRDGTGGYSSTLDWASIEVRVTGVGGVPARGVSAVVLNVTATRSQTGGFLTVFPGATPRPNTSSLNFGPGQSVPNLVMSKVGPNGTIEIYSQAYGAAVVVDVVGWFGADGAPGGDRLTTVQPARILDTRAGVGAPAGPLGPGATLPVDVTGVGGVPASGVSAVVLNMTITQPSLGGYLTVFPSGLARPTASNLNFGPGQTVPNLVVAKVGTDGSVALYNQAGTTHAIADVVGWYGD